jgi:general secretion pathway protein G
MSSNRPVGSVFVALGLASLFRVGTGQEPEPPRAASEQPPTARSAGASGSALYVHSAGLDALLPDERDAGLVRALALLDERLLELGAELGERGPPPAMIELASATLSAPWTLRIDLIEADESPVPLRAQWTVEAGSLEAASALAARLAAFLADGGVGSTPSASHPGLLEIATAVGSVLHGARGSAFVVAWGEPRDELVVRAGLGLPSGVEPAFALELDLGALLARLVEAAPPDDPPGELIVRQLQALGALGPDGLAYALALGHGPDRTHFAARCRNWVGMSRRTGSLAGVPLPADALRLVPGDATLAVLAQGEPRGLLWAVQAMEQEAEVGLLAALADGFGIDLAADVLEPLGTTSGFYLADTTGGGGLASAVAFVTVDDEVRLARTLEVLTDALNARAARALEGHVRVRAFEAGGVRCLGLEFPGLPVPFAPALALGGGHLFVAATPQALEAALAHVQARTGGLGERADVRPLASMTDVQSVLFADVPALVRAHYGATTMLAAMLTNFLRSPADSEREPGPVLPPYLELVAGARPTILVARIEGEDLVVSGTADRSAMVQVAAAAGWAQSLVPVWIGALALVAVPTVTRELHMSERAAAEASVVTLRSALDDYAVENLGHYPESLEVLVTPDELGRRYLNRETVPLDPWGNPYLYALVDGRPRIVSYGADGVPGGEGDDADVDSAVLLEAARER